MEKKINLEEILTNSFNGKYWDVPFEPCKRAMLEFGKQLLELAAENANIKEVEVYPFIPTLKGEYKPTIKNVVDKSSITDTINQIK